MPVDQAPFEEARRPAKPAPAELARAGPAPSLPTPLSPLAPPGKAGALVGRPPPHLWRLWGPWRVVRPPGQFLLVCPYMPFIIYESSSQLRVASADAGAAKPAVPARASTTAE